MQCIFLGRCTVSVARETGNASRVMVQIMLAGCSKMPSSKAAASEEARRTLRYVESSERCENDAGGLFQHPVRRMELAG